MVPYESEDPFKDVEIPDFDLSQMLDTIEKENTMALATTSQGGGYTSTTTIAQRSIQRSSPKMPIFQGCKIGNINITFQKN